MPKEYLDWTEADGKGWLCVRCTDNKYSEPKRITCWYPIIQISRAALKWNILDPELLPVEVRQIGHCGGLYEARDISITGKKFRLLDGGQTKPIRVDEEDIPPPKARTHVKYEYARWWKLLKTRGWVPA